MVKRTPKNFVATVEAEFRHFFSQFLHNESIGGIILLICTVISLLCANIPELGALHDLWGISAGISVGDFSLSMSIGHWINDGLMAIFFFVVGLEIKREMLVGELSSFKHALLPIFAAIGGMLVPAILYTLFNSQGGYSHGWGIPMATDIAFALGVISLLGKRVPLGLKVFLTALAIVDDLGAIVVLALFYPSHALHFDMLLYAMAVVMLLYFFNRNKVSNMLFYIVPGIVLWFLILKSGIHATIAGVILAMTIPSRTVINEVKFVVRARYLLEKFKNAGNSDVEVLANPTQQHIIHRIERHVQKINPLLHKFEAMLHPWVTFFIMPIFALANSGVGISLGLFTPEVMPVTKGIFTGLLLGKPLGIFLFSFISVKLGLAELPAGTKWKQIFALGIVAGIGFTMSIFIDSLAFTDEHLINVGKAAILGTSSLAAAIGLGAMVLTCKNKKIG